MTPEEIQAEIARLEQENQELLGQSQGPGFLTQVTGGPGGISDKATNFASQLGTGALNSVKGLIPRGPFEGDIRNEDGTIDPQKEAQAFGQVRENMIHPISNSIPIPGINTAIRAGEDFIASKFLGEEQAPMPSGGDYGKQIFEGVSQGIGGAGTMLAASSVAPYALQPKKTLGAVKERYLGRSEANLLAEQALYPEAIANKLGFAAKRTDPEYHALEGAGRYSDTFAKVNPTKGIDTSVTSPLAGPESMSKVRTNLEIAKNEASINRDRVLQSAAIKENEIFQTTGQKLGIKFEDIPESVQVDIPVTDGSVPSPRSYGLNDIAISTGDTLGAGVAEAQNWMRQQFGIQQELDLGGSMSGLMGGKRSAPKFTQGRALTASEANTLREKLDGQITAQKGYNETQAIQENKNPSIGDSALKTYQFYRRQLDNVIKGHVGKVLGEDAAIKFADDGDIIAMQKTYDPLIDRFQKETGQAFIPGSAKQMPANQGFMGRAGQVATNIAEEISPGVADRKTASGNLGVQRDINAVRQLQALVDAQTNQVRPMPRYIAQIKMNAEHYQNFANTAIGLGIIRNQEELANMPDPMLSNLAGMISQNMPQAFEQTPDKVNVIDGKLVNPQEADMLKRQAAEKSAHERAIAMIDLNQNKYVPPSPGQAPVSSAQPVQPDIGTLSSLLPEDSGMATAMPQPMPTGPVDQLTQFLDASARHAGDGWH